jgi:hypothetical protein
VPAVVDTPRGLQNDVMAKMPLSPMLAQCLVGLCALKWDANAVDVTIGDMVRDEASETTRDVDVTVTVDAPDGVHAFKGYEVKHLKAPLDQSDIDGLAGKLNDMPSVTHRAIVSTSGYAAPAIKKAAAKGIDLFEIKEWTKPLEEQFPHLAPMVGAPAETIKGRSGFLQWSFPSTRFWLGCTGAPQFEISYDTKLYSADGNEHAVFGNFSAFTDAMTLRSTDTLFTLEQARSRIGPLVEFHSPDAPEMPKPEPEWPYAHTLDVASDDVYLLVEDKPYRIDTLTIYGHLRWRFEPMRYYIMEKIPTGEPFAGALIGQSGVPGQMHAVILSAKDRTMDIRFVQLEDKHLNAIRRLKLILPEDDSAAD